MADTQAPPPPGSPHPVADASKTAYTAPWWQIHAWGVGVIASYFMYEQFYLINAIHTTVFKISPIIVGWILASPRLFDGILDPIIGHWSDNMRSRFGRRKPFLLFAAILGALMASSLFWMSPDWSEWTKSVILTFSAIMLFTATGTYDMSHTALGYELSDGYADRSRVQAIMRVYHAAMGTVGGYFIWMSGNLSTMGDFLFGKPPHNWLSAWATWRPHTVIQGWFTPLPNEVIGFRFLSSVVSIVILISVLFPLFFVEERFRKINRKHVDLWQAMKATFRCRPFVVILIINFTRGTGTLFRNLVFFVGTYYVCFGDKDKYTEIMNGHTALIGFGFSILTWLLTKKITGLIGKRTAFIAAAGVNFVDAVGTLFIATPGNVWVWFWFKITLVPINQLFGAAAAGIMPDICDIDELEHGERREGLFSAVQAFVSKMEISVMTVLSGFFLVWTGFDVNLPQQQPGVLECMRWMAFIPLLLISGISFAISFLMPLTEGMMNQVRAELDARHAAAGVLGVVAPTIGEAGTAGG